MSVSEWPFLTLYVDKISRYFMNEHSTSHNAERQGQVSIRLKWNKLINLALLALLNILQKNSWEIKLDFMTVKPATPKSSVNL